MGHILILTFSAIKQAHTTDVLTISVLFPRRNLDQMSLVL